MSEGSFLLGLITCIVGQLWQGKLECFGGMGGKLECFGGMGGKLECFGGVGGEAGMFFLVCVCVGGGGGGGDLFP